MLTIITGHYGSGKTTLAVNLAVKAAREGKKTAVADLDIVNPFFRAADSLPLFKELGIETVIPYGANTNLESVYLPPEVEKLFYEDGERILDVGGDDDGAIVLGRYADKIKSVGYEMICTVSKYRPFTKTPAEAAGMIKAIETASGLTVTGIANTSSLGDETDFETVAASVKYAEETASLSGKPLLYTAVMEPLWSGLTEKQKADIGEAFPVTIYTKRLF